MNYELSLRCHAIIEWRNLTNQKRVESVYLFVCNVTATKNWVNLWKSSKFSVKSVNERLIGIICEKKENTSKQMNIHWADASADNELPRAIHYGWKMPPSTICNQNINFHFRCSLLLHRACFRSLKFLIADIKLSTQAHVKCIYNNNTCIRIGKLCLSFVKILNLTAFSLLWIAVEIRSLIYCHRFGTCCFWDHSFEHLFCKLSEENSVFVGIEVWL